MYDSQRNSAEVQKNGTGSFSDVSSGLTFGPIIRKQGLPEWAINWSRNRFGLDASSVNLCIVDKQEGNEPFAAASGNNIFVTSKYKNNKSVLMHEITHIYQQAVGSATESNMGDQSLEDEAVKVSNGEEILLSKKQDLSDKYIVPKENTNIVQSFGGLALGLLLGGIFLAGAATVGAVSLLTRHMKCKKIAKETGVSIDCVKMVYKAFGWAEAKFGPEDFKELCKVVEEKGEKITWEKLKNDGEALKNNHGEDGIKRYVEGLKSEGSGTVKKQEGMNKSTEEKDHNGCKMSEAESALMKRTITDEYTKNLRNATCIVIEDGVQEIERSAFSGFKKLKEIHIPETVTNIRNSAFIFCDSLKKVILPSKLQTIGSEAFTGCTELREIEIPDSVTEIEDGTFEGCLGLSRVKLPNKLKKIGSKAFKNCKSLNRIDLPESIEKIGENAFIFCEKIDKVVLPKELKKLSKNFFCGCISLKEISLPENMTEIEDYAFYECTSLEKVVLVRSINKIGKSVFEGCSNLVEVINFPKVLQEIGSGAFRDCSSLKNVCVPSGIPKIGMGTFRNCKGIKEANIPEGVKSIGDQAFEDCTNLEKVSIPESVESIGDYAFADCENLADVNNFPKLCGKGAFLNCERLKLPAGIDNGIKHQNVLDQNFIYKDYMEIEKSLKVKNMNDMPLFSAGGPKMRDIRQGKIGDCWLVASLASIVKNNPKTIENIMKDNKDGTVDVTLRRESEPGRFKKEVYTVKKSLFRIKQGLSSSDDNVMSRSKENIWVQMIEKACSAYFSRSEESINYYSITGGGGIGRDAFKIILGKEAKEGYDSKALSGDRKELFERIKKALVSKTPLWYGINRQKGVVKDVDGDKLVTTHAFSLIGAEEKDGRYYITLRNPWGYNRDKNYKPKNAIIKVDLEEATNVDFQIENLGRKQGK